MHAQIRAEVNRQERLHPERSHNVKLGRGGIREIEFLAQVFQLIRGGRDAGPARALDPQDPAPAGRARTAGRRHRRRACWRPTPSCATWNTACNTWTTPRPTPCPPRPRTGAHGGAHDGPARRSRAAGRAGRAARLRRQPVRRHLRRQGAARRRRRSTRGASAAPTRTTATPSPTAWPASASTTRTPPPTAWSRPGRRRACRPCPKPAATAWWRWSTPPCRRSPRWCAEAGVGSHAATLGRLLDFFEAIARRSAYLSLLTEYPHTLERVIRMINASGWAATFLTQHPILLDELLDDRAAAPPPTTCPALAAEPGRPARRRRGRHRAPARHPARSPPRPAVPPAGAGPGRRTVGRAPGRPPVGAGRPDRRRNRRGAPGAPSPRRHREVPRFAVIAYGKLGGKELGYVSDLDVIFLFDDDDQDGARQLRQAGPALHHLDDHPHPGRHPVRHRHRAAPGRRLRHAGVLGRPPSSATSAARPGSGSTRR